MPDDPPLFSPAMVHELLMVMAEAAIVTDEHFVIVSANPASTELFGIPVDELVGQPIEVLVPSADRERHDRLTAAFLASGTPATTMRRRPRVRGVRADGREFPAEISVVRLGGAHPLLLVVVHDLAGLEAERELRRSRQRFALVLEHAPTGIVALDDHDHVIFANPAAHAIFGEHLADGPLDRDRWRRMVRAQDVGPVLDALDHVGELGRVDVEVGIVRRQQPGMVLAEATFIHTPTGLYLHVVDVTEKRRTEQNLEFHATHDSLTGLPNRARMEQRLTELVGAVGPSGPAVAVMFVDLDHFKYVNDSLGHAFGDRVLEVVAGRLRHQLRDADVVVRFGGDEFVVVWTLSPEEVSRPDRSTALSVMADRVLATVAAPMMLGAVPTTVTASVGVAAAYAPGADATSLLGDADAALYLAKQRGRNQAAVFDVALRHEIERRREVEQDLRQAIQHGELVLLYQPIIEFATGAVIGHEALVRWVQADGTLVPPGEFLTVAEDTGLVVPMGRQVLTMGASTLAGWQLELGDAAPFVSVNVSPRQLADPDFVADVLGVVRSTGADPHGLVIEITEHTGMVDLDASRRKLQALRDIGIRVAIDDFGTGYSSLSMLTDFPADILKIDGSFVKRIGDADRRREGALVDAIIAMSRALDLRVVAEGIEELWQLDHLRAAGCELGQGYLLGRPANADTPVDQTAWIASSTSSRVERRAGMSAAT